MHSKREYIRDVREKIDHAINSGTTAYGMNTLFGEKDSTKVFNTNDFITLLEKHLVGTPKPLDPLLVESLLKVKVHQVETLETGISLEGYDNLIKTYDEKLFNNWEGAIDLSYGSGSVVPGAWVAKNLQEHSNMDFTIPGDLMAIINGDYISVGYSDYLLPGIKENLYKAISFVDRIHYDEVKYTGVQAPVSCRDVRPLKDAVSNSIHQLEKAIETALNNSSGNPLYVLDENDKITVKSNSSFLNYDLLFALNNVFSAIKISIAYILGAYRYKAKLLENGSADDMVQPQKVISSISMRGIAFPSVFSIAESALVEDICDRTIEAVLAVENSLTDLKEALAIIESFPVV